MAVLIVAEGALIYIRSNKESQSFITNSESIDFWKLFESISMKRTYFEELDTYYRIPIFTPEIEKYSGQEITISGYYLPYAKLDSVVIISRYPNKSCFFCGQAGIESVAMVELNKSAPMFETDQTLVARGTLSLNSSDFKKLAFIIEDAAVSSAQN